MTSTLRSSRLASLLWGQTEGTEGTTETWEYMYSLAVVRPFHVRYEEMNRLAGYEPKNIVREFNVLDPDQSAPFFEAYSLTDPSLAVEPPPVQEPPAPFDPNAETDRTVLSRQRLEQSFLRQILGLEAGGSQRCDLCGMSYPVTLLVAAHIKKRAACSDQERNDRRNVVMRCCSFGCDAVYERGLIYVDPGGTVRISGRPGATSDLLERFRLFAGRRCSAFRPETTQYFDWHRTNVANLAESTLGT
ncbi:MAG: hypothetical protein WBZ07_03115 [Candidatus Dormiibacterota bacterium]